VVKVTGKEGTKKWVTPREAAKELGLSIRTIYDLIHDGRVQAREEELDWQQTVLAHPDR